MKKLICIILTILMMFSMVSAISDDNTAQILEDGDIVLPSEEEMEHGSNIDLVSEEDDGKGFLKRIMEWLKSLFGIKVAGDDVNVHEDINVKGENRGISMTATINEELQETVSKVLKLHAELIAPDPTDIAAIAEKINQLPPGVQDTVKSNWKRNVQDYPNLLDEPDAINNIVDDTIVELDETIATGNIPSEGFTATVSDGLTNSDVTEIKATIEQSGTNAVIASGTTVPLSFQVLTADGKPAAGETVEVFITPEGLGVVTPATGVTDANGNFNGELIVQEGISLETGTIQGKVISAESTTDYASILIADPIYSNSIELILKEVAASSAVVR